jgi:hypothetical protein
MILLRSTLVELVIRHKVLVVELYVILYNGIVLRIDYGVTAKRLG